MQMSIHITEFGTHKVRCRSCARPMRLVGIELHPTIPDLVDLVTFACACGEVIAEPRFAELEFAAPVN